MPKSAGAIRKRRTVRVRHKKTVTNQRRQIQRGAKVKPTAPRKGSGILPVEQVWDRRKSLRENYAAIGLNNDVRNQRVLGAEATARTSSGVKGLAVDNTNGLGAVDIGNSDEEGTASTLAVSASTPMVCALEKAAADIAAHNKTIGPRMTSGERKFIEVRRLRSEAFCLVGTDRGGCPGAAPKTRNKTWFLSCHGQRHQIKSFTGNRWCAKTQM